MSRVKDVEGPRTTRPRVGSDGLIFSFFLSWEGLEESPSCSQTLVPPTQTLGRECWGQESGDGRTSATVQKRCAADMRTGSLTGAPEGEETEAPLLTVDGTMDGVPVGGGRGVPCTSGLYCVVYNTVVKYCGMYPYCVEEANKGGSRGGGRSQTVRARFRFSRDPSRNK